MSCWGGGDQDITPQSGWVPTPYSQCVWASTQGAGTAVPPTPAPAAQGLPPPGREPLSLLLSKRVPPGETDLPLRVPDLQEREKLILLVAFMGTRRSEVASWPQPPAPTPPNHGWSSIFVIYYMPVLLLGEFSKAHRGEGKWENGPRCHPLPSTRDDVQTGQVPLRWCTATW